MAILASEPITKQEYNGFELHALDGVDEDGNLVKHYAEADTFDLCEDESKALCFGCFTHTDGIGLVWFADLTTKEEAIAFVAQHNPQELPVNFG